MLPDTVLIDVGDVLLRLRAHLAYRRGLPTSAIEPDSPESPSNIEINDYIEMVVDTLVSHNRAIESLKYLLHNAVMMNHAGMDERTCDILEVLGTMIHFQLADLRLYTPNDGPLNYFYTGRGDDWITLSLYSREMDKRIATQIQESQLSKLGVTRGRW